MASVELLEIPDRPYEAYPLGSIEHIETVSPEAFGIIDPHLRPRSIDVVTVRDPFVAEYKEDDRLEVGKIEWEYAEVAKERFAQGFWQREPGTAYYYLDPHNGTLQKVSEEDRKANGDRRWGDSYTSKTFFHELDSPIINEWHTKKIPRATALLDLYDPKKAAGMDATARKWLSLCTDAIAIRSRAAVMADVLSWFVEQKKRSPKFYKDIDDWQWLSMACGTALPSMKAAQSVGLDPTMMLVDFDPVAFEAIDQVADEINFSRAKLVKNEKYIFSAEALDQLSQELEAAQARPMVMDAMGIFEYTSAKTMDPVEFMRANYKILKPGGRLIFGQMRADRPVLDFTMGVVGWPYVQARSLNEIMNIVHQAGIPTECTSLYLPYDGVYAVGAIDKPEDAE
jgi:SAM-dependent methyltransferase